MGAMADPVAPAPLRLRKWEVVAGHCVSILLTREANGHDDDLRLDVATRAFTERLADPHPPTEGRPASSLGEPDYITRAELVDALGCFWNAALYATHEARDSTANAVMSGMVGGVAAVAERLKQPPVREALLSSVQHEALKLAEAFMAGFEDDPAQVGLGASLTAIRSAIALAEGRPTPSPTSQEA